MQGIRHRKRPATVLAILASLAAFQGASAQDIDPGIVEAMTGTWLAAPADGSPGCRLVLSKEGAIGGFALEGPENACVGKVPALSDAAAWNFGENGELIFIDPLRKVLMRFEEQEGSPYRSIGEPQVLLLHEPPEALDRISTAAGLAGSWVLKRPGGTALCTLTLAADKADDDSYPLSPDGDCDAAVKKLKLFRFQLNGLSLTLMGEDGSSLALEEIKPGHFEKSKEEGGKPLVMERKS